MAQLYLKQPLLLEGRKFHLRLWLVVTQHDPLLAFLHRQGMNGCLGWEGTGSKACGLFSVLGSVWQGHVLSRLGPRHDWGQGR